MLAPEKIEEILRQEEYGQKEYWKFYQKNPKAYDRPINNWEEFCSRFSEKLPENSPTLIKEFLSEKEFFPNEDVQVYCFKNVRYCPPFLHKLEFIKIVYIIEGSAVFYLNDRRFEMTEGNFCIVAPEVKQALFTADPKGIAINILMRASTFTKTFSVLLSEQGILGDFFSRMAYTNYCNRVLFFNAKPDRRMKQTVLGLYDQVQLEVKKSNLVQESYVCIFLGEGIRRHSQDMKILEGLDGSVWQIPEILQDIRTHLQAITLKELASRWNRSEDSLRYELKMETGYSFFRLLNDIRIQTAADLLCRTRKSIEEIIEEIGCNDSTAFYRNFKKRYGMTPQTYRIEKSGKV